MKKILAAGVILVAAAGAVYAAISIIRREKVYATIDLEKIRSER